MMSIIWTSRRRRTYRAVGVCCGFGRLRFVISLRGRRIEEPVGWATRETLGLFHIWWSYVPIVLLARIVSLAKRVDHFADPLCETFRLGHGSFATFLVRSCVVCHVSPIHQTLYQAWVELSLTDKSGHAYDTFECRYTSKLSWEIKTSKNDCLPLKEHWQRTIHAAIYMICKFVYLH